LPTTSIALGIRFLRRMSTEPAVFTDRPVNAASKEVTTTGGRAKIRTCVPAKKKRRQSDPPPFAILSNCSYIKRRITCQGKLGNGVSFRSCVLRVLSRGRANSLTVRLSMAGRFANAAFPGAIFASPISTAQPHHIHLACKLWHQSCAWTTNASNRGIRLKATGPKSDRLQKDCDE